MAPPLYFFPKLTRKELAPEGKLSPAVLSRFGSDLVRTFADLTDLRADAMLTELTGPGPGGSSGCLLCALPVEGEPPPRLCYAPDFQTWTAVGDLYIGIDNEHPIESADLLRKSTFPGYNVELAGQTWIVPVIRDPDGGTGLPRDFVYADGGKVEQRIKAAYVDIWEKFARVVWLMFDPEGPWPLEMDLTEGTDLCLAALALNYRVGRIEQNLLGLINSDSWIMIMAASTDCPTFRDVYDTVVRQKKTRAAAADRSSISREIAASPESTDSSPGPEAACPGTAPAGES